MNARRPEQNESLRVLVIGVGHLGKNHARVYGELPDVELVGVVDSDPQRAQEIAGGLGVAAFERLTDELLARVHAVSVVTPTPTHYEVAKRCIEAGVSTLVEKPVTSTVEQARELRDLAKDRGVTLQVGHIERFNPVVLAATEGLRAPAFIECDRIHPFSFRSMETSVVLDLMIHDIDLVLHIVDAPVAKLDSVGACILSETEDLANNRMTFENGCTAMFKASRVAIQKSRKMRIFSEDSYVSVDYVAKTGMRISMKEGFDRSQIDFAEMAKLEESTGTLPIFTRLLDIEQLHIPDQEPLRNELESFARSVRNATEPVVTAEHGLQALEVAIRIQESIRENQELYLRRQMEQRGKSRADLERLERYEGAARREEGRRR